MSRPPLLLRALFGFAAFVGMLFAGVLMLSDRAPGIVRTVLGDRARRLWEHVDERDRAGRLNREDLPEPDAMLHIVLWAVVAFLVIVTVWRIWWLIVGAAGVFALSVFVEIGQGRYADTRSVEFDDVLANALGVMIGAAAAVVCFVTWSALAAMLRGVKA